ncbi:hypothetical protein [Clostridium sporogenes]|nr:hypothetical protein [Clostridium sporogenes]
MEFKTILFELLIKEEIKISNIEDVSDEIINIIKENQDNII